MGRPRRRCAGHAHRKGRTDSRRNSCAGSRRHRQGRSHAVRRRRDLRGCGRGPCHRRHQSGRAVRRPAVPHERPRPHHEGPAAGNGLALHARQPRDGRHVHDVEDARRRAQFDRSHHHAGIRRLQLGRQSGNLCHAQSLEYRLHHLRLVCRQRRDGRRRRGADRAFHRWRRFDPDPRRRQRQYRAEGLARRVLAVAALVRSLGAGLDSRLPVAHGARHRGLRRCLPRPCARRVHAVLVAARALHAR